jgi:putative aminopeptidase FrvX
MPRFEVSTDYLAKFLEDLVNTPSPTGDTAWAVGLVEAELQALGIESRRTRKGALVAQMDGLRQEAPRVLASHLDTLGAVVAKIKPNGRLGLSALNGLVWPTVESEGATVRTRGGASVRGSLVLENGSSHVNKEVATAKRDATTLELRLDERTTSAEETRLLGVEIGDFVAFDPRFEASPSGFVRARFLDDKAGVACVLAAAKALVEAGVTPAQTSTLLFSVHEEVGHGGGDGLPDSVAELVVVDMACVGEGQNGDEFHCSVCVKDAGGPYSQRLTGRLMDLAGSAGIELRPDVYPHYASDGTAYWRMGGEAEVALVGPGVDTSHGYERTHRDALRDTAALLAEYLADG